MTQDGPPPRHLHPVEPPFDPEYDNPGRTPSHDRTAEQALLNVLVTRPEAATELDTELNADDFYRPEHASIWATWHQLYSTGGVPPDAIVLNSHLTQAHDTNAVRALTDIVLAPGHPALLDQYVALVRDHARIRAVQQAHTRLGQQLHNATPATLDRALGDALDTIEQATLRFGPTAGGGTGLKDLSWLIGGQPPVIPPPSVLERSDGTHLFYAGKVNGIFGDPECGKTWLAQAAGVEALNNGGTFAMIDVDHNGPDHTAARLLLLGARIDHLADPDRFRYYEPDEPEELRAAVAEVTRLSPTVLIIDSLGEIFPMLGVNTNDGDEMTSAMRLVCTAPAQARGPHAPDGPCVITIDHLPKGQDARATGYAIGSIAKKRMIRGAYLRAEARTQPAPGTIGRITLRIEKDTAGELRKTSGGGYAGTFTLDSSQALGNGAYATTWSVAREEAPKNDDGSFRPTALMEQVSRYVEDNDQCSKAEIEKHVAGGAKYIRMAIDLLVSEGFIARIAGARNSHLHHSLAHYRQQEDTHVADPD